MRWRYSRAFLWGLLASAVAFTTGNLADGGRDLSLWANNGTKGELIGYYGTQILMWPILFMTIALIRNIVVHIRESE